MFHNDQQTFQKAWSSLLYLTRIYFAAVILLRFATELGFESIKFESIPAVKPSTSGTSHTRSLTEVMASLGFSALPRSWQKFFSHSERADHFAQVARQTKSVHAEVQLILHVANTLRDGRRPTKGPFAYIGCSKKCCFLCELFCKSHGTFEVRGTHKTVFPLWALPRMLPQESLQVLREFLKLLKNVLFRILTSPHPPPKGDLRQQSSAALSTLGTVQREVTTFSSRPQTLKYVRIHKVCLSH